MDNGLSCSTTGLGLATRGVLCDMGLPTRGLICINAITEPLADFAPIRLTSLVCCSLHVLDGGRPVMPIKHYIGEVGTPVIMYVGQELGTATVTEIRVKKPDGTIVTWDADVYTLAGEAHYLRYFVQSGDLDQAGKYELQSYVEVGIYRGPGETDQWVVHELWS